MNFFTKEKGISGWLSPNGEFIPVEYGMHDSVARTFEEYKIVNPILDKRCNYNIAHGERLFELLGYIKFVFRYKGTSEIESFVFFPQQFGYYKDTTNEQFQWIEDNYEHMSELQKRYCISYLNYSHKVNGAS